MKNLSLALLFVGYLGFGASAQACPPQQWECHGECRPFWSGPCEEPAEATPFASVTVEGQHWESAGGCDPSQHDAQLDADAAAARACGGAATRTSAYQVLQRCNFWSGSGLDRVRANYACTGSG